MIRTCSFTCSACNPSIRRLIRFIVDAAQILDVERQCFTFHYENHHRARRRLCHRHLVEHIRIQAGQDGDAHVCSHELFEHLLGNASRLLHLVRSDRSDIEILRCRLNNEPEDVVGMVADFRAFRTDRADDEAALLCHGQ